MRVCEYYEVHDGAERTNEKREYQVCTRCVMDTTDSSITFDEHGVCDHCLDFETNVKPNWHTDERGKRELDNIIHKIKEDGKGRDFDCIMGMSGG